MWLLGFFPRVDGADAVFVNDDDFAGFDVADVFGVDEVEGTGFTGEDVGGVDALVEMFSEVGATGNGLGPSDFTKAKRAKTVGIANADELILAHDDERVGTLDLSHDRFERVDAVAIMRARHEMKNDLAIDGGLENGALIFEFRAEAGGVCEVAVVADGDLAAGAIDDKRLGVF